jgi:uncharacterized protein YbjQ (UPF0145 family)
MTKLIRWNIGAVLLALTQASFAADTFLDLPVDAALKSPHASTLLDVPVFMSGQEHPAIVKTVGEYTSNKRTNAFNKSNEEACTIAFLSAIISLQDRAKKEGGNAVVDIKSITKHNDLVSATQFRCVAGAMIANVALTGTVATTKP